VFVCANVSCRDSGTASVPRANPFSVPLSRHIRLRRLGSFSQTAQRAGRVRETRPHTSYGFAVWPLRRTCNLTRCGEPPKFVRHPERESRDLGREEGAEKNNQRHHPSAQVPRLTARNDGNSPLRGLSPASGRRATRHVALASIWFCCPSSRGGAGERVPLSERSESKGA